MVFKKGKAARIYKSTKRGYGCFSIYLIFFTTLLAVVQSIL